SAVAAHHRDGAGRRGDRCGAHAAARHRGGTVAAFWWGRGCVFGAFFPRRFLPAGVAMAALAGRGGDERDTVGVVVSLRAECADAEIPVAHGGLNYRVAGRCRGVGTGDRKSTRLNSSHVSISYAVFCLKKK